MATIKSYTSLEQSKKLAEMLPVESADMHYATWTILDGEFIVSPNQGSTIESLQEDFGNQIIPCWSLAALLDQMICPKLENYVQNMWDLDAATDDTLQRWLSVQDCPTAIDACVEMIIKQHEHNIL